MNLMWVDDLQYSYYKRVNVTLNLNIAIFSGFRIQSQSQEDVELVKTVQNSTIQKYYRNIMCSIQMLH